MLKITDLRKQYGKVTALDGVDLQVNQGETVVVMGPSGCGKSTLIRCINRLTEPDGGSIQFAGVDVLQLENGELQDLRRSIGFVFQQFNLIIAGVVGVEHWTRSPCAPVILGLVAFTLVISLWIVLLCLLKKSRYGA